MADTITKALTTVNLIKALGGWIVALIMMILGAVFWIQDSGDSKYYPLVKGEHLEQQLSRVEQKLDKYDEKNDKILQLVSELKGSIGNIRNSGNP